MSAVPRTLTVEQKAERRRRRLDKRRRTELPLLAATGTLDTVAPLPTIEEVLDWYKRLSDYIAEKHAQSAAYVTAERAKLCAAAERYLSIDQINHVNAYITRVYPPTDEYWIGHWDNLLTELGALGVEARDRREAILRWWTEHPVGPWRRKA